MFDRCAQAIGASLPDAITMGVVAKNGHGAMAVGGLVGSNIFDILMVSCDNCCLFVCLVLARWSLFSS